MTAYMEHKDLANESIDEARARNIADGVHRVLDEVAQAEEQAGRPAGSVQVLAAAKTRDVGEIMAAVDAGIRLLGENRPQEIVAKIDGLRTQGAQRGLVIGASDLETAEGADDPEALNRLPLHLIGQLQSNKIGKVLPDADVIESVATLDLAEKIARRMAVRGRTMGVLIEVNESGEDSKSGIAPDEALDLALAVAALDGVEVQGFMTVGAHVDDEATVRAGFAHLRGLRDAALAAGVASARELSMGMTGDKEWAIAEGATIVRIGTGIFGERDFK